MIQAAATPASALEERVLVLAPLGRDGAVIRRSLADAGIDARECAELPELCAALREGAGAAILAAEAVSSPDCIRLLAATLAEQPTWSDLPLVILALPARSMRPMEELLAQLGPTGGNATVLERPVHVFSMVTTVQMALRSRRRQYQVRDQLVESERQASSLRESEARFRELADTMPLIVWAARPDGYVDYYNKRWREYTGQAGALGHESWVPMLHPDDKARCLEAFDASIRSGETFEAEYRFKDRFTGGYRWHLGRALPVRGPDGEIRRWLGTCVDIQQIVEAREMMARGRAELESLVRERTQELEETHRRLRTSERMASLGTLSAGLGHDMGNLLLPVRVRLESLTSAPLPHEAKEDVYAIRRAAEYLQRLANGLRLLAIDSDTDERRDERTDPESWWADVEGLLRNVLPRGVALERRMPDSPPMLRISPPALTQAVFNLVQNAGEAMRTGGGGRVVIALERGPDNGTVRLMVSDDGPGMTAEVRARCLEPFFSTKARSISTGLGLVLVGGLIHAAGGQVDLESEPGEGTTFTLTLHEARATEKDEHKPLAVVSLEDSRMRAFVCSVLRVLDLEVTDAASPDADACLWVIEDRAEALEAASRFAAGGPSRAVVVFGEAAIGGDPSRVFSLGTSPKPAVVRRTLAQAVRGCRPAEQRV